MKLASFEKERKVRRSVVVLISVATVLALSIGTALAQDRSDNQGDGKGQKQQRATKATAAKGQQRQATNASATATSRATDETETTYGFKGTVAQDGADGRPFEVRVEKANDDARSLVGKNVKVKVSSGTAIYRDGATADGEGSDVDSDLDAKLSDLKQGDEVLVQAKAPKNATSFTASLISADAFDADATVTNGTSTNGTSTNATNTEKTNTKA
jgi:hypothetical protein